MEIGTPKFLQKEKEPESTQIEISPNSEEDLKKLEDWLKNMLDEEAAEQCVFILRSMTDLNLANQCKEATKEFGQGLAQKFGDEESFFELSPNANYSDARGYPPFKKTGRFGDYHSVGLLDFKSPEKDSEKKPFSLVFDLTYRSGFGKDKKILVIHVAGGKKQALDVLKKQYGGNWEIDLIFNKETSTLVFNG